MKNLRYIRSLLSLRQPQSGSTTTADFQVFSDLHLEVCKQYSTWSFPAKAPYLILAGDIGRMIDYNEFLNFLDCQTSRFEAVFLALGNHEFYGSSHPEGIELAKKLESEPQLHGKLILLHRKRFDIPDLNITILGCSLWSHIRDDAQLIIRSKVSDFERISGWTTATHNAEHAKDIEWLREQVRAVQQENRANDKAETRGTVQSQRKILIITHHAPCLKGTSEPRFDGSDLSGAFATDLLNRKEEWKDVMTWIYGHTHYSTELQRAGVKVISNQRGYVLPGSNMKPPEGLGKGKWKKFDEEFVVSV